MEKQPKTRICKKCGKRKLLSAFYKNKRYKYKVRSQCKKCDSETNKKYMMEHKEERSLYTKNYRKNNKIKVQKARRKCYKKNFKKERTNALKYYYKHLEKYVKNYKLRIKNKPWLSSYYNARIRCNNKKHVSYKYYGAKGISFLMTQEDFKFLWFRDKAYLMKRPSIDRKNSKGDYILGNCKFIELKKNVIKALKERYDKI